MADSPRPGSSYVETTGVEVDDASLQLGKQASTSATFCFVAASAAVASCPPHASTSSTRACRPKDGSERPASTLACFHRDRTPGFWRARRTGSTSEAGVRAAMGEGLVIEFVGLACHHAFRGEKRPETASRTSLQ